MEMLSAQQSIGDAVLSGKRLDLTLDAVVNRLPRITLPLADDALEAYLNALYQVGRLRHVPNISPMNVAFLQQLIQQKQPKRILEMGCANGYSSLRLWQVAKAWQAKLVTMDISRVTHVEAAHHFKVLAAPITLHLGDALLIVPELIAQQAKFDFILIDAQKINTLRFYQLALQCAAPNATIVIDDVIKFKTKMQSFYDYLAASQTPYHIQSIGDDDDGVMVINL